jgi:uncharacterized membrane protein YgaE (UPF0421/DUF939 family)
MEIIPYQIVLSLDQLNRRDDKFYQIQKLIDNKRRFLLQKQKKIHLIERHNHFLTEVKNDYTRYFTYILQQKYQQMKAMEILNNYIRDLTISGKLSKQNLEDAKQEQKKIITEFNTIKQSLDSLISDVGYIGNTLNEKKIN